MQREQKKTRFEMVMDELFGDKVINRPDLMKVLFDYMDKKLTEAEFHLTKSEKLINSCYEMCVCERFKTTGFDYHEEHPREGKPKPGSRFNTPRDMIEGVIGFKWKYEHPSKPGKSWKELQFKKYDNKRQGFY